MTSFLSAWYFHLPNFVLAALTYTLLGRLVLGLFVPEDWDNYIWRFFRLVTDPVVRLVRAITPAILSHQVVLVFAVLWTMAARIAIYFLLASLGLMGGAAQGA